MSNKFLEKYPQFYTPKIGDIVRCKQDLKRDIKEGTIGKIVFAYQYNKMYYLIQAGTKAFYRTAGTFVLDTDEQVS